jgi:putative hydrolase of the HAD superfamily
MADSPSAIGFDADDTLWHNERFFRLSQEQFTSLLADHADPDHLGARLLAAEKRNIGRYGFGIKGFTLSMIETAIEVTDARVPAATIGQILDMGREMLAHPIELLPHARAAVEHAAERMPVILITKGDLLDQERKLAQSGLGDLFAAVEIVSDKTPARYRDIFARHADGSARGVMVGNSMKSDIVPMIEAGGWAVHVPHDLGWALEHAHAPSQAARFHEIADLGALPALLDSLI